MGSRDSRDAISLYGEPTDLTNANLFKANLEKADLRGAVLEGAELGEAVLRGADLRGAVLRGTFLGGANLQRADLRSAHLTGVLTVGHEDGSVVRQLMTNEELDQKGALLRSATMPNGQKYEDWLKSKGSGEDVEDSSP